MLVPASLPPKSGIWTGMANTMGVSGIEAMRGQRRVHRRREPTACTAAPAEVRTAVQRQEEWQWTLFW